MLLETDLAELFSSSGFSITFWMVSACERLQLQFQQCNQRKGIGQLSCIAAAPRYVIDLEPARPTSLPGAWAACCGLQRSQRWRQGERLGTSCPDTYAQAWRALQQRAASMPACFQKAPQTFSAISIANMEMHLACFYSSCLMPRPAMPPAPCTELSA